LHNSCVTVVQEIRNMRWVSRGTYVIGPTMWDLLMSLDSCTTIAQLLCKNHVPKFIFKQEPMNTITIVQYNKNGMSMYYVALRQPLFKRSI